MQKRGVKRFYFLRQVFTVVKFREIIVQWREVKGAMDQMETAAIGVGKHGIFQLEVGVFMRGLWYEFLPKTVLVMNFINAIC